MHRVQFTTDAGLFEVPAASFAAAIDIVINALAADVRAESIVSERGTRYEPEIIEKAVRQKLADYSR